MLYSNHHSVSFPPQPKLNVIVGFCDLIKRSVKILLSMVCVMLLSSWIEKNYLQSQEEWRGWKRQNEVSLHVRNVIVLVNSFDDKVIDLKQHNLKEEKEGNVSVKSHVVEEHEAWHPVKLKSKFEDPWMEGASNNPNNNSPQPSKSFECTSRFAGSLSKPKTKKENAGRKFYQGHQSIDCDGFPLENVIMLATSTMEWYLNSRCDIFEEKW